MAAKKAALDIFSGDPDDFLLHGMTDEEATQVVIEAIERRVESDVAP